MELADQMAWTMFGQWGSIGFLVAEEGGKGDHQEGAVHNDL